VRKTAKAQGAMKAGLLEESALLVFLATPIIRSDYTFLFHKKKESLMYIAK